MRLTLTPIPARIPVVRDSMMDSDGAVCQASGAGARQEGRREAGRETEESVRGKDEEK